MDSTGSLSPVIRASDMFNVLSNFKYNSFIKDDKCFPLVNKQTYPCLTYNMEFVLRKYGTPE